MNRLGRGVCRLALVGSLAAFAGCGNDAKPDPNAVGSGSASGARSARTFTPPPKVDAKTMKEYRVDVCVYGTLTLKHARDSYLASLGKDEPSEKKIPNFGSPPVGGTAPLPTLAPGASGSAGAKAPPKKSADEKPKPPPPKASGSAGAAPSGSASAAARRPLDVMVRAPHEKNARGCKVAAGLKDPPMADVDGALTEFAPFIEELAKNVAQAQTYYQREEYKKDSFEKGKEFHKKLTEGFGKLDAMYGKVETAAAAYRKGNAHDLAKAEEGEKLGWAATEDARDALAAALAAKVDVEAYKKAVEKFGKSIEGLKTFGSSNGNDPWPKILAPALEQFERALKAAQEKISEKGLASDDYLPLVTGFTNVIEARHRALSRALIVKSNPNLVDPSRMPQPGRPMQRPTKPAQPQDDPH